MAKGSLARNHGFLVALLVGVFVWLAQPAVAEEILTNESIVSMVKAGLPETVIAAKIRASKTKFDTGTEALIALKQAGVPDRVLEAMVAPAAVPATPSAQGIGAPTRPGDSATADPYPKLYHLAGSNAMELRRVRGEYETNAYVLFGKSQVVFPRPRAEYRISERQPVFYSPSPDAQVTLVRLEPGKEDRNLPMGIMHVGKVWAGTQKNGPPEKVTVKVTTTMDPRGGTRIELVEPLQPGEYGFLFSGYRLDLLAEFGVD